MANRPGRVLGAPPPCLCGRSDYEIVQEYRAPPAGEVPFDLGGPFGYFRRILRCRKCGHFRSVHDMDMAALYGGAYVDSTYGEEGMRRAFDRIVALDPAKSDNVGRVDRIVAFAKNQIDAAKSPPAILDVGSGLCVFLHRMQRVAGWDCTALDPDARAVRHAQSTAGVKGVCGDFTELAELGAYDVITFNKVLEHVLDPGAMLGKSAAHLRPGGFVYVELPDGERAAEVGFDREEFFVDHHHVFSLESVRMLAARAAFSIIDVQRLREPSGKFTLFAYVRPMTFSSAARSHA